MRSGLLSLALAAGALGLTLATPGQTRADELVGPAITNGNTIPVHWHGGWYGRGFYPGYGGGYYRGYYPGVYRGYYPYGGYGGFNRRYYYGGWGSPYYGGFGGWPYSGYYW
jgi:hypothetical protein